MGEEIGRVAFGPADFARFGKRLREETALLGNWFDQNRFSQVGHTIGFELEAWLIDHNGVPHSVNERFLSILDHPFVVPELSRFNVEFNCTPQPLSGLAFRRAETEMAELWARCNAVAHSLDANMVMIGTLPTIREKDLTLENMSPLNRYYALNSEVLRRRHGKPLRIDITGREHLIVEHGDVMLEAATTSFQVHLKVPAALAHRYLNASLLASGPILAACANAPFLFGKSLWEETRIPLFEQAVSLAGAHAHVHRVTFGDKYVDGSLYELWQENLKEYPVLLPLCFDEPPQALRHLRLHNGTIWRWNRPLLGFEKDGQPHLRIEHRILPAGPTFIDMMANAALYVGLVHHLVGRGVDLDEKLGFREARRNFYTAARNGLSAEFDWSAQTRVRADRLLLDALIPAADDGLADLKIEISDRRRYLGVIEARTRNGQTGAAWQRACFDAQGRDFFKLMATYCERQRSGVPVHEWDL